MTSRGDDYLSGLVPMIEAYVKILRSNFVSYPKRVYTRSAGGEKVQVVFSVPQLPLPNSTTTPGPINVSVFINGDKVFMADVGGNAALIMLDGLRMDTRAEVEVFDTSKHSFKLFQQYLPYLIREAQLSL